MDEKCNLLKNRLLELNEEELCAFIDRFDQADADLYTWPLWAAAYIMNGGCSDDAFSDFRATLISMGREIYEAALNDPESLVELDLDDPEDICYEGYQYVKNDAAEEKLGSIPDRKTKFPNDPAGDEWDEDTLYKNYPKLTAKYASYVIKDSDTDNSDDNKSDPDSVKPWWKFWKH